jgi:putative ATP-dependent endonuclease of the OLD family
MDLVSFSVARYRSIVNAEKLPIGDLTILIGPNNEGKSNILRALVVGMRILSQARPIGIIRGQYRSTTPFQQDYQWDRDFPIQLQTKEPDGDSIFDFEFQLTAEEVADFAKEVQSSLNGTLPIRLSINRKRILFQVKKKGPGAKALTGKRDAIVTFLSSRIQLEYVQAIRTATEATQIVRRLVDQELAEAEQDPAFAAALTKIEELQAPILEALSVTLGDSLRAFLPDVDLVKVTLSREARATALRRDCHIVIDDGVPTDLNQKGDGVQSLAALSLIRHAAERAAGDREQILAVEEPEAHLHPNAIHQLRAVLQEISKSQQVVVTTHCPLLINRLDVSSNIIVEGNKARPAKSVRDVRETLGVRTSDNLMAADVVLVVEGENDRRALRALLPQLSPELGHAIADGMLAIDTLGGGSNLAYKLSQLRDSLCAPHAYLDHDAAGKLAAKKAEDEGLLTPADTTFVICAGMPESEIEDMYDPAIYVEAIKSKWGVDLVKPKFKTNKKWTDRVREVFLHAGKQWTPETEKLVKKQVAESVSARHQPLS